MELRRYGHLVLLENALLQKHDVLHRPLEAKLILVYLQFPAFYLAIAQNVVRRVIQVLEVA